MRIAEILSHRQRLLHKTRTVDSVGDAARILAEHDIGALLVYEPWGHYAGIFSERDLIQGLARLGARTLDVPVGELMTADVITCSPEQRVREALRIMTVHRIRHLPVEERGKITGIVSIGDLVHGLLEEKALEIGVLRDLTARHG
jgi:CBS domain-containing protein